MLGIMKKIKGGSIYERKYTVIRRSTHKSGIGCGKRRMVLFNSRCGWCAC